MFRKLNALLWLRVTSSYQQFNFVSDFIDAFFNIAVFI